MSGKTYGDVLAGHPHKSEILRILGKSERAGLPRGLQTAICPGCGQKYIVKYNPNGACPDCFEWPPEETETEGDEDEEDEYALQERFL